MIFDDLKKANLVAMKEHDAIAHSILPIAINKIQMFNVEQRAKGIALTDGDCLVLIGKVIKELEEEIIAFEKANRTEKVNELKAQREVLVKYLPRMLTEDEIRAEIAKLEDKSMPNVMKHFKTNFQGQVDMKLVSTIARG